MSLADTAPEAAQAHEAVAKRLGEATAKAIRARAEHEQAITDDAAKAEAAIRSGSPLPKPKAEKTEAALREAERELAAVAAALPMSARELLHAVEPHAAAVAERMSEAADELEAQALARLGEVRELLDASDRARAEGSWAATLAAGEPVRPFSGSTAPGRASGVIVEARQAIEYEASERRRRRDEMEYERRAVNTVRRGDTLVELPPPPTEREPAPA